MKIQDFSSIPESKLESQIQLLRKKKIKIYVVVTANITQYNNSNNSNY